MSDIVHVIRATAAPTAAPTREGQHWIDTVNKVMYFSVGTSSVSDWVALNVSGTNPALKAGIVLNSSFSGSPKKATVTFSSSLVTPYAVNISGVDTRAWSVESVTSTGFVINSNANQTLTGDVFWEVQESGEF